jgi:hypothetical protein
LQAIDFIIQLQASEVYTALQWSAPAASTAKAVAAAAVATAVFKQASKPQHSYHPCIIALFLWFPTVFAAPLSS